MEDSCLRLHHQTLPRNQAWNNTLLELIREKLHRFPPIARQPEEDDIREAAVLMALTTEAEPELVFIKRAEHLNSHSGQVAFPGGMWEAHDGSLLDTALRESEEEIALQPAHVDLIACLEPRETRFNVRVTPYVGLIPSGLSFIPEPAELDAVFQVPLLFLADERNLTSTIYEMGETRLRVPCYFYQQYCIWGFTLHLLADFLQHVLGMAVPLEYENLTTPAR